MAFSAMAVWSPQGAWVSLGSFSACQKAALLYSKTIFRIQDQIFPWKEGLWEASCATIERRRTFDRAAGGFMSTHVLRACAPCDVVYVFVRSNGGSREESSTCLSKKRHSL